MNTVEYIELAKVRKGIDSDNKLANELGWNRQKISNYRNLPQQMDNEAARQMAEYIEIPVLQIIADMEAERQKDPAKKKAWKMLAKLSKETGKISPNLLILQGVFSFVSVAFYILCKIAHGQDYVQLRSEYELA